MNTEQTESSAAGGASALTDELGTDDAETYKIFCAFGDNCWRQRIASGEFHDFDAACREADRVAKNDNWLRVDYTVATGRDDEELYRAPYVPN